MSDTSDAGMSHEEARERLMEAVEAIYEVQTEYPHLSEEGKEMLEDAKCGIGAVHFHADEEEVVFDL